MHAEETPTVARAFAPLYRVEKELGRGTTATVYLAEELKHRRLVALKVLRPDVCTAIDRKRFLREIRMTAQLSHPNVLGLYDSGEIEGYLFYVMPFITGETLSSRLQREGTLPLDIACSIVGQVARGLSMAHSLGYVHRDVKPGNILLDGGHVLLADFGVATAIQSSATDPLTTGGSAVGTPIYMSPEQLTAMGNLDPRTDQYSLACVAYEILLGHPPFFGPDTHDSVMEKVSGRPPPFSGAGETIPRPVQDVIRRALAVRREERFPDVVQFADSLLASSRPHRAVSTAPERVISPGRSAKSLGLAAGKFRRIVQFVLSRSLYDQPATAANATLPHPTTSFIGRESQVAELQSLLAEAGRPLVTIVGEPGVGKTRLAVEVARSVDKRFKDGIFYVPLAPIQTPAAVLPEIARAFNLPGVEASNARQQIFGFARSKQMLLVLDNFEHLLEAAQEIGEIAELSAVAKVLVTSRQRLGVQMETVYKLSGLAVEPAHPEGSAEEQGAIALFVARTQHAKLPLLCHSDRPHVERICRLLGGNPLALELAAAWANLIPLDHLANEIDKSLDLLSTQKTDIPVRHASMRAAINQSLDLLSPTERRAFEGLGAFRGSFDHAAAHAILGVDIRTLASLVEKSLLTALPAGRFELHEMLRQYASELLDDSASLGSDFHRKHADYYSALVGESTPGLIGGRQKQASDRIRNEAGNIAKMWNWSCDNSHIEALDRALDGLWIYYFTFSFEGHGELLLSKAVESLQGRAGHHQASLYQRCLMRWAFLLERMERYDEAKRISPEACHLASALEDDREQGLCFEITGLLSWPDRAKMAEQLHAAERAYFMAGDAWSQARTVRRLAAVTEASNREAAAQFHQAALRLSRSIGDRLGEATSLSGLAWDSLYRQGKLNEARMMRNEALRIREEYGDWATLRPLNGLVWDEIAIGNVPAAVAHAERGMRLSKELGDQMWGLSFMLGLANAEWEAGEAQMAECLLKEAFEAALELGDIHSAGIVSGMLAQMLSLHGREDEAILLFDRARDLWEAADKMSTEYHPVTWWTLAEEAVLLARRGAWSEARSRLFSVLEATVRNHGFHGSVMCIRRFADLLVIEGKLERAVELLSFVTSYHGSWYESRWRAERSLRQLQRQLPGKAYRKTYNLGKRLTLADVLAQVSIELRSDPERGSPIGGESQAG